MAAKAKVFIDANVFLYATGEESPHRRHCRAVLAAVADGTIAGVTSSEVLQELLHVRSRRLGMLDAISAVRTASVLVNEVLAVGGDDLLAACDLLSKHPQLGARDAIHAAVMKNAGIGTIISVDKDFDKLAQLKRVNPKDALRP